MIVPDLDPLRVPAATPIQSHQLQGCPNDGMDRTPVLNMKEVDPLTKNLGLVIHLDSQAQFCVQTTQPSLQLIQDSLVHHEAAARAGIRGAFKTMARYQRGRPSRRLWHQDAF